MYDIIVIGSDVSALIAAVLAVDRGASTLLISDEEEQAPLCLDGVFSFPPFPLPWTGLDESGVLTAFLNNMDITAPTSRPEAAGLQVILPSQSVDFRGNIECRTRDTARDFKLDHGTAGIFFDAIRKEADHVRRSVAGYLNDSNGRTERFRLESGERLGRFMRYRKRLFRNLQAEIQGPALEAFEAEYALLSPYRRYGLFSDLSSYCRDLSLKGSFHLSPEGKRAIVESLKMKFLSASGTMVQCEKVESVKKGQPFAVETSMGDRNDRYRGDNLVVSTKWSGLPMLATNDRPLSMWMKNCFEAQRFPSYPFTLHMGVKESVIPDMMGEHMIISCGNSPGKLYAPFLYLYTSQRCANGAAPEGARALSLTAMLTRSPLLLGEATLRYLATYMARVLHRYFPFLSDGTAAFDQDASIGQSRATAHRFGHGFCARGRPYGGFPLVSSATPTPGLFLAGGELAPILGFDGDVVIAIDAARRACGETSYAFYP